ncbi:MAG: single-stranded DNA-binding protein [Clostridiales bacterium]|nr:single-stranded DNA-binding protein [Clostridiales bacterium]
MLNKAILMGRLTRDPELKHTQSNIPVVTFTLAVDRGFGRNQETQQQTTDFINIVAWRNTAEFVSKYFRKGQLVAVSGRIQVRNWKDRDDNNRVSVEVVADECYFAEPKRSDYSASPQIQEEEDTKSGSMPEVRSEFEELIGEDDELPF